MLNPKLCQEHGDKINIVYTPIHGAGLNPVVKIFDAYGFKNITVIAEQREPDSNFPTVTSPNPENPSALKMAVDKMLEINADFAAGTDPDCDRIGIAINQKGTPIYLNGNQLGTLMLHYILKNLKEQNRLPENSYFVQSIVTTPLQQQIADSFGVKTERTLTGFKWICGRVREIEASNPERKFLFGTEESFGYLNHPFARDKDGTGPMGLLAEMALFYKMQGKTLVDAMDDIYDEYGFSNEDLLNLVFEGKEGSEKIARAMVNFRARKNEYILFEEIEVIQDYELQFEKNYITGKETPITIAKSNVLGYRFKSGNILYLRPSGTEPKIKFYIMIRENIGTLNEKKAKAIEKNNAILEFIKKEVEKA
jgi:phosphoglucomutase